MRTLQTALVIVACMATVPAWGDTILDSRPSGGGVVVGNYSWNTWAQTFTVPANLTDVSVNLFFQRPDNLTIQRDGWEDTRVWLMSEVGPGATSADVVAYKTLPPETMPTNPVFTLPALGAGDYAIVVGPSRYMYPAPSPTGWWWLMGAPVNSVTMGDFGVHALATYSPSRFVERSFPPASNFATGALGTTNTLAVLVTGTVPEPATLALLGLGMAGLMASRRRRRG